MTVVVVPGVGNKADIDPQCGYASLQWLFGLNLTLRKMA